MAVACGHVLFRIVRPVATACRRAILVEEIGHTGNPYDKTKIFALNIERRYSHLQKGIVYPYMYKVYVLQLITAYYSEVNLHTYA